MIQHTDISIVELRESIQSGQVRFGGNATLKIYGTLSCSFGKRIKKQNRVFFLDEKEATSNGYRPCGHCLREEYFKWVKDNNAEPFLPTAGRPTSRDRKQN